MATPRVGVGAEVLASFSTLCWKSAWWVFLFQTSNLYFSLVKSTQWRPPEWEWVRKCLPAFQLYVENQHAEFFFFKQVIFTFHLFTQPNATVVSHISLYKYSTKPSCLSVSVARPHLRHPFKVSIIGAVHVFTSSSHFCVDWSVSLRIFWILFTLQSHHFLAKPPFVCIARRLGRPFYGIWVENEFQIFHCAEKYNRI